VSTVEEGVLDRLVVEAVALRFDHLPDDVVELACQCFLDVAGCAIAGSAEPVSTVLRSVSDDAALNLGTAAHALDFDDWAPGSGAHPSVTIVPAILAALEVRAGACTGRELIRSFVGAYEFQERLGIAISPSHYDIGFHTTGIVGTFGATVGSALVLGADAAQLTTAVKIAATEAAGLKSVFGSMGKPLNAGRAAQAGYLAARLAVAGFEGAAGDDVFGAQGFAPTHSTDVDLEAVARPFADAWTLRSHLFKHYPSCFGTHAAIMAAESLRRTHGIFARSVTAIELTVPPIALPVCAIPVPTTGLEGKFSLAYCVSAAVEGDVTTASFADELPMSPDVSRLMHSVRLRTDNDFPKTRTVVELSLGGRRLVADADAGCRPWSTDPRESRPSLLRKFRDLAQPVIGSAGSDDLAGRLLELADADTEAVDGLQRLLTASEGG
jgi:2-methylcitrate dehydratase PrpD